VNANPPTPAWIPNGNNFPEFLLRTRISIVFVSLAATEVKIIERLQQSPAFEDQNSSASHFMTDQSSKKSNGNEARAQRRRSSKELRVAPFSTGSKSKGGL
jgi:hypothetical protein